MTPFYALLTNTEAVDPMRQLPIYIGAFAAVVLLIAFFIGFYKGFRKVRWGGFVWVAASAGFFLLEYFLGAGNPLKPLMATFIAGEKTVAFLSSLGLMLACVIAALFLQGLCSWLFRPRAKIVNRKSNRLEKYDSAIDYDEEEMDYEDYENNRLNKMIVRKGYGKPSFFGRIFGALICLVNVAAVLVVVIATALLIICATPLKDAAFASMFKNGYMPFIQEYTFKYAFDFLIIGLVLNMAQKGFKNGFMESIRALIIGVGRLAGIGLAFYLPFSSFVAPAEKGGVEILHSYVLRCVDAATTMGLPGTVAPIVGQIIAGLLLFVLVLLVFALLNFLLKKLTEAVAGIGLLRVIDGTLACLVYMVIGVAICIFIATAFYVLGAYGIFDVKTLLLGDSFAKKLIDVCGVYIQPALDNFNGMIKGLIPAA